MLPWFHHLNVAASFAALIQFYHLSNKSTMLHSGPWFHHFILCHQFILPITWKKSLKIFSLWFPDPEQSFNFLRMIQWFNESVSYITFLTFFLTILQSNWLKSLKMMNFSRSRKVRCSELLWKEVKKLMVLKIFPKKWVVLLIWCMILANMTWDTWCVGHGSPY